MKTFHQIREAKMDLSAFSPHDQKIIKKLLAKIKNPSEQELEAAIAIGLSNNGRIDDKHVTGDAKKGIASLAKTGSIVKKGSRYHLNWSPYNK